MEGKDRESNVGGSLVRALIHSRVDVGGLMESLFLNLNVGSEHEFDLDECGDEQAEVIEAFCSCLKSLSGTSGLSSKVHDIVVKAVWGLYIPVLRRDPRDISNNAGLQIFSTIIQSIRHVANLELACPTCEQDFGEVLWRMCLRSLALLGQDLDIPFGGLQKYDVKSVNGCCLTFNTSEAFEALSLNSLSCLLVMQDLLTGAENGLNEDCKRERNFLEHEIDNLANVLITFVFSSDSKVANMSGNEILPTLFRVMRKSSIFSGENIKALTEKLWEIVVVLISNSSSLDPFSLLCSNYRFFLEGDFAIRLLEADLFWSSLQKGLNHKTETLTRKRCLYLLKRIVESLSDAPRDISEDTTLFVWSVRDSVEIRKWWDKFFLVYEVVDENQYHIVEPVIPYLVQLTSLTVGTYGLKAPSSWVELLFLRIFNNDNNKVIRLGLDTFLSLDFKNGYGRDFSESFVFDKVFNNLNGKPLFRVHPEADTYEAPMGKSLKNFFCNYFSSLPDTDRPHFFRLTLKSLSDCRFDQVSTLYLLEAVSHIPKCAGWGDSELNVIRGIMELSFLTHRKYVRVGEQRFILSAITRFADPRTMSYKALVNFFSLFPVDEGFICGTAHWKEFRDWIFQTQLQSEYTAHDYQFDLVGEGEMSLYNYLCEAIYFLFFPKSNSMCSTGDNTGIEGIARLIMLFKDNHRAFENAIQPLLERMCSLETHAYVPDQVVKNILVFVVAFEKELGSLGNESDVHQISALFAPYADMFLQYLARKVLIEVEFGIDERNEMLLYIKACEVALFGKAFGLRIAEEVRERLVNISLPYIHGCIGEDVEQSDGFWKQMRLLAHLKFLDVVLKCQCSAKLNIGILETVSKRELNYSFPKHSGLTSKEWGKLFEEYMMARFSIVAESLRESQINTFELDFLHSILESAIENIGILSRQSIPAMTDCMRLLSRYLAQDEVYTKTIENAIYSVWQAVEENHTTSSFILNMEAFVQFVFDPVIMQSEALSCLKPAEDNIHIRYLQKVLSKAELKSGAANVLSYQLAKVFVKFPELLQFAELCIDSVLSLFCFGPDRKHLMVEQAAVSYLQELDLKNNLAYSQSIYGVDRMDSFVRMSMWDMLLQLSVTKAEHTKFVHVLLETIFNAAEKECKDKLSNLGQFRNSSLHLETLRLWQTALLCIPFVEENRIEAVMDRLLEMLQYDNLSSIRVYVEWMCSLLITKRKTCLQKVVKYIRNFNERPAPLCSYLSILIYSAKHWFTKEQANGIELTAEEVRDFYKLCIMDIIPWMCVQNYTVRSYAQASVFRLCSMCDTTTKSLNSKIVSFFDSEDPSLKACLTSLLNIPECIKQRKKPERDYFFSTFDPIRDFNIEAIFNTIPKVCQICQGEFVSAKFLEHFALSEGKSLENRYVHVPVGKCSLVEAFQYLDVRASFKNIMKNVEAPEQSKQEVVEDAVPSDLQKKIVPWQSLLEGDSDLLSSFVYLNEGRGRGDLIVVASFIEKMPNLGGLCRTGEIFNINSMTVNSLSIRNDATFKALCVTSDRWLPLEEVKVPDVLDFMLKKKKEGYKLVGVEQTANSECLTQYSFAKKTLLLLGKEKEGIPIELIHHLDDCVEIPQLGVIRSLNVHVSGALMMWEYTKQMMGNT
eukprot:Nk52_evm62s1992 gene=Nk52_evmTU62s1992